MSKANLLCYAIKVFNWKRPKCAPWHLYFDTETVTVNVVWSRCHTMRFILIRDRTYFCWLNSECGMKCILGSCILIYVLVTKVIVCSIRLAKPRVVTKVYYSTHVCLAKEVVSYIRIIFASTTMGNLNCKLLSCARNQFWEIEASRKQSPTVTLLCVACCLKLTRSFNMFRK